MITDLETLLNQDQFKQLVEAINTNQEYYMSGNGLTIKSESTDDSLFLLISYERQKEESCLANEEVDQFQKYLESLDDDLFIDAVDFEYCWRALSKGFIVVKNLESIIGHKLGNGISSFFNLKYISPSPIRHYYQFRNFILLSKRNYVPFYWKISTFIKYLLSLIFLPFLFQQRVKRFKYMINGIYDGILGKKRIN